MDPQFLADLPQVRVPANEPATDGPRAALLSTELGRLQRMNTRLQHVLSRVFSEVQLNDQPLSAESYLPPALVAEIAEALHEADRR